MRLGGPPEVLGVPWDPSWDGGGSWCYFFGGGSHPEVWGGGPGSQDEIKAPNYQAGGGPDGMLGVPWDPRWGGVGGGGSWCYFWGGGSEGGSSTPV